MKQIKFLLLLLTLIIVSTNVNAQRSCNAMEVLDRQIQADPERALQLEKIERMIQEYQDNPNQRNADVYTIPVVFHVVYKTAAQNISDAQIQTQLDVLNEDFRRMNSDANNTWSQAADVEIEFCLATVDPDGNPTSGITRTSTNVNVFTDDDKVKKNSTGGHDAWPAGDYLNFWVCNLDGFLGYAQFPGGPAATDGVVCAYQYTGTIGSAQAPFDLGRTATHEVGHWLNLYHIWGDGGCGVDDGVNDTPKSDAPNYGCASNHTSCSSQDMVQNYMDYSDDACMNLFTLGQKNRMRALFTGNGPRASLLNSPGCGNGSGDTQAPSTPTNLSANNTTQTSTVLNWTASTDNVGVTGYNVYVDGSLVGTSNNTNYTVTALSASTTYAMSVAAFDAAGNVSGQTSINVTTLANGGGDTQAPSTPTNLTASNTTQTSTALNWTASTDNVGVTGYNIYVDGSLVGTSNNTNYTVTGLSASTTYTMSVAAFDAAGNVSSQASTNVTTLANNGGGNADAGVRKIIRPKVSSCLGSFKPIVQIKNFGSTTINSVTINYSIDGDNFSKQWTGTLLPGKVKSVGLPKVVSSVGAHQMIASTSNPNGASDINPANDSKSRNYTITGDQVKIQIKPDDYGSEITWTVTDDNGNVVVSGGPYSDFDRKLKTKKICLLEGCYTFRIEDSYGDGICCDYGNGYYKIRASNNSVIISSNGQYGNFSEQEFCIGSGGNTRGSISEDQKVERGLKLMPNPATDFVLIETNGAQAGSVLRVVNTLGQSVQEIEVTESNSRIELDLSTFENGMYIIQLDDGRKPMSKKLMVFR